jgi:hypothetical protein
MDLLGNVFPFFCLFSITHTCNQLRRGLFRREVSLDSRTKKWKGQSDRSEPRRGGGHLYLLSWHYINIYRETDGWAIMFVEGCVPWTDTCRARDLLRVDMDEEIFRDGFKGSLIGPTMSPPGPQVCAIVDFFLRDWAQRRL